MSCRSWIKGWLLAGRAGILLMKWMLWLVVKSIQQLYVAQVKKMGIIAKRMFSKKSRLPHTYIKVLFVSGEDDIDVKKLELLVQQYVEKRGAVCWVSSVQQKDAKRKKIMEKDTRRIILSITGTVQKINTQKGRTQFHTSHFRRWYEVGDIQIPRTLTQKTLSQTTPIGVVQTSILRIIPEEYSQELEDVYARYQRKFYKSPFIDTEHNPVIFRFEATCTTGSGDLIAQDSFIETGELREQEEYLSRFAKRLTVWLCR